MCIVSNAPRVLGPVLRFAVLQCPRAVSMLLRPVAQDWPPGHVSKVELPLFSGGTTLAAMVAVVALTLCRAGRYSFTLFS